MIKIRFKVKYKKKYLVFLAILPWLLLLKVNKIEASQGIEPVTRTEVSPAITGSWQDVDVSSYVPAGAVGVILEVINVNAVVQTWGVRKNGSTDSSSGQIGDVSILQAAIGIDGNRIFEAWRGHTDVHFWLIGYVPAGAGEFVTNRVDKSLGTTGVWTDIDISAQTTGGVAKFAFFQIVSGAGFGYRCALRENGSTDDRTALQLYDTNKLHSLVMSVDANEILEGYIASINQDFYYIGCIYADYAVSWANAKDYSTTTTGSWVTTTIFDVTSISNGIFFSFSPADTTNPWEYRGIRRNGNTYENYQRVGNYYNGWVAIDGSKQLNQKIYATNLDLWVLGYVKEAGPPSIRFEGTKMEGIQVN